jgi:hypothetical protein
MAAKKKYQFTNKAYVIMGIAIIGILFLLVLTQTTKEFTFEEGFNEITKLDEKYETSFKTEKLPTDLINYKNVDPYVKDLGELREEVANSIDKTYSKEKEALLLFIDARALMLLSQKSYTMAETLGPRGLAEGEQGFSCLDAGYLINGAYYINKSYSAGLEAYLLLDRLLGNNQNTSNVWELIGIDEEKPNFFYSNLGGMKITVERNIIALEDYCLIDMSQGLISPVDPEGYILINRN